VAGTIGGLVFLFLILFEWNWFRSPIERRVFDKTGRHLNIEGEIKVELRFPPIVRIGKIRYENPE
jgi:uncharacterized protein involved in outer membrane biogenesis